MRYAIFTDIHANLEAMEAVLAKIDELAKDNPIDQIWFLGDLVGYGPNPNECIAKLRERTNVIIAGNHDWAAVGKIDLEDFSTAARISAEWTTKQLTEEHKAFLAGLPERIELGECTLVHGSPYGPLWEYLTSDSDVLAERSFQYFSTRFCFVGHTHVPVIFQQPDTIATTPTLPLLDQNGKTGTSNHHEEQEVDEDDEETTELVAIQPPAHTTSVASQAQSAYADPETGQTLSQEDANTLAQVRQAEHVLQPDTDEHERYDQGEDENTPDDAEQPVMVLESPTKDTDELSHSEETESVIEGQEIRTTPTSQGNDVSEVIVLNTDDRRNAEIEELLTLLGLSLSMIQVTNEVVVPPEGHWDAPAGYRAIINPGGVGQPRDGDSRAAFMIYDSEKGFDFYRIPYPFEKTQEKIIQAGLPQYLAVRLAYGR